MYGAQLRWPLMSVLTGNSGFAIFRQSPTGTHGSKPRGPPMAGERRPRRLPDGA